MRKLTALALLCTVTSHAELGRLSLGQSMERVKATYPQTRYVGSELDFPGHYWICNSDLGVVAQAGRVRAIVLRSPKYTVDRVAVGMSPERIETTLEGRGVLRLMRYFPAPSAKVVQRPFLEDHLDHKLRVYYYNLKVQRILICQYREDLDL